MRTLITLLLLVCLSLNVIAQGEPLKSKQWQEDLKQLQTEVHENYASLFVKTTPDEFDAAVEQLHKDIPDMEEAQIIVEMAKIVALFGYGHSRLVLPMSHDDYPNPFHQMPYNLYWFSDGVFVQGVHKDFAKAAGAKVLQIGEMSIEDAIKAVYPVVSVENAQFFKAYGLNYLGIVEVLEACKITKGGNKVSLKLEKDGEVFDMEFAPRSLEGATRHYGLLQTGGDWLDARDQGATALWQKDLDKIYAYTYLPEQKAVYVRQSQVWDDEHRTLEDFYQEVFSFIDENEVEKFIIDVRLNGGGNNYKNKDVITGIIRAEKINKPGNFFVIIGRRTFSACQNLVNELDNYTEVTFIGEPTAENINFFGDVNVLRLENSQLTVRLSHAWWQNKAPWDKREWMPPHMAVDVSFEDYKNNHDPILEAIWNFEVAEYLDPMGHLYTLFQQGKVEELRNKAAEFVKSPQYKYVDFEAEFIRAGNSILGSEMYQESIFVFSMTTEFFPDSWEAYSGLAEAFWKSGDIVKAKELYKKVMAMDVEGDTGKNAMKMLEKIKQEESKK